MAAVVVAVAISGALIGIPAWPAAGHAQLVASTPADRTTIAEAPTQVLLEFSGRLIADTASVTATGPQGEQALTTAGSSTTVTARWPAAWSQGDFRVAYRVASSDGHIMTGAIRFTVTSKPTNDPSAATTADPPPTADADQNAIGPTTDSTEASPGAVPPWLATVAILGAVGLAAWWLVSRRREGSRD